ncbi:guanine deaminase [Alteromonas sp. ASW11-36]|uniref:Guanine deaminase n=2 Tax=Alteromonas arenosi TaxID=3055817 RepID=A0ABT7SYV6_9ALTE|nr:guanine deaminase [Alteromonas sp. ASW11-36]MDM7861345.1 guanine deaminase [Alteromonas sp. ASW11-36]
MSIEHAKRKIICADILDFLDDPSIAGDDAVRYFEQGALVIDQGKVLDLGAEKDIVAKYADITEVVRHDGKLLVPGLIDTHIHLPQTEMIGSHGEQLLTWLTEYAFPTEKKFADHAYAADISKRFLDELLRNGTTTAMVFGTVHPESVDAFFTEAQQRRMRMIAGKVLMDRNCPEDLADTPELGYSQSKALIEKWHNVDRLAYAVTPRFAPTSSHEQLAACKQLLDEYPDVYMQSHLSENIEECEWVDKLFPASDDYLGAYEDAGLVRKRAVFAHGIHLSERELISLAKHQAALSHCPTSNLFLGSGLFNLKACEKHKVTVGMGTDVGAGTSFSLLQTGSEAYKIQQLQGENFTAFKGLYLATLGGARALDLEGSIGNFTPGCEADFVILDHHATPFLSFRLQHAKTLHERLFAIMMLGDDRCIEHTYVLGDCIYQRDAQPQFASSNTTPLREVS